jgi:thiamine transport system permease protein
MTRLVANSSQKVRRWGWFAAGVSVPLFVITLFFVFPVAGMIGKGFFTDGNFAPQQVAQTLFQPRVRGVLWFTIWSSLLATALALGLGTPCAYVLYRLAVPGQTWWRALLLIPFVLPSLVVGVAFRQLLADHGPLGFLGWDGTPWAIIAGLVFFNISVVIRVVGGAWSDLDPRPGEAAAALGSSPWRVWWTVTVPQLRLAFLNAAVLVFLFCATAFGIVLILGGVRYATVETEIYLLTTNLLDLPAAAALSLVQLALVALLMGFSANLATGSRAALVPCSPRKMRRGDGLPVAVTALTAVALVAPLLTLVVGALRNESGWTTRYFRSLNTVGQEDLGVTVTQAMVNSLRNATDATWISVSLGLCIAVVLTRPALYTWEVKVQRLLDTLFVLPLGVSAVTLGFGLLITLASPPLAWRDAPLLVPLAQALVALPLVVRSLTVALANIDPRQREAAASLGASPARVLWSIDLSRLKRPLLAAIGFAFAVALGEFGATAFLARDDHPTLPILIYRLLGSPGVDHYQSALAASVVLGGLTALVMLCVERLAGQGGANEVRTS